MAGRHKVWTDEKKKNNLTFTLSQLYRIEA